MESELLKIGTKLEFMTVQGDEEQVTKKHTYYSQITDFKKEGMIQVMMPMEEGRMVALSLSERYHVIAYTDKGIYQGIGEVVDRYKTENFYFLDIVFRGPLEKKQRREFFRCECLIDVKYVTLEQQEAEAVEKGVITEKEFPVEKTIEEAVAVDISGGGIRLISKKNQEDGSFIMVKIPLTIGSVNQEYCVLGTIVSCKRIEDNINRYENRIQFVDIDRRVQEKVIRFIFDEERKARKLSKG